MMRRYSVAILLYLGAVAPASAVIPVASDGVIAPARYFDLHGKTLRFTPSRRAYVLATSKAKSPDELGTRLGWPDFPHARSWTWRRSIPFGFPFGGSTWREVFVNSAGNLTFGRPEAELYQEREPWPDGTMQALAGALNNRAAAGQEKMICAFWGLYAPDDSKSSVFVRENAREFVVTWQVERYLFFGEGYRSLGPNFFQARLTPDGAIEFRYHRISEKDGIVGLFFGGAEARRLDTLVAAEEASDPRIKIRSVEAALSGTTLRFTFLMDAPIMTSVPEHGLWYYVLLKNGARTCEIGVEVRSSARAYQLGECKGIPAFRVEGNRLDFYASVFDRASVLANPVRWQAEVLWERKPNLALRHRAGDHPLDLPPGAFQTTRLSVTRGYREGNVGEVFHYPQVDKSLFPQLRYIYQRFEPQDDFAVVLTDFRIDDLHNHQGGLGGFNLPIQGIGDRLARVNNGAAVLGSTKLQLATGPVYRGPRFEEQLEDGRQNYRNYANAVGWMAHELGHHWGIALKFRNPLDGTIVDLTGGDGHWSEFLNTRSMISVWRMFSDQPYSEKSQMEGYVYEELPDGTFRRHLPPWNIASGFSALDLYVMGLIGPGDVPDTFLISDPQGTSEHFQARKVPVRVQDIIAACGERVPGVQESQKEFTIGIYLLHEGNRPPYPEKLSQARGIEKSLIEYFQAATGGRMRLVAASPGKRSDMPNAR